MLPFKFIFQKTFCCFLMALDQESSRYSK